MRDSAFPRISSPVAGVLPILIAWALLFHLFLHPGEACGSPSEPRVQAVDTFAAGPGQEKEGVPAGWTLEGKYGPQSGILLRGKEGGYLILASVSDSFGLKKEIALDPSKFPRLSWQWRVVRHPAGGDIRQKTRDDQAGQVYVIFGKFPLFLHYRALGYIWDPTAPVGYKGASRTYPRMKYRVIRSGTAGLDQWMEESRDIQADFRTVFQEEPPPVAGLILFINTQFTGSSAECHYRNILFGERPTGSTRPEKNPE